MSGGIQGGNARRKVGFEDCDTLVISRDEMAFMNNEERCICLLYIHIRYTRTINIPHGNESL